MTALLQQAYDALAADHDIHHVLASPVWAQSRDLFVSESEMLGTTLIVWAHGDTIRWAYLDELEHVYSASELSVFAENMHSQTS